MPRIRLLQSEEYLLSADPKPLSPPTTEAPATPGLEDHLVTREVAEQQGYADGFARGQADGYTAAWDAGRAQADQARETLLAAIRERIPGVVADLDQLADWARLLKREAILDTAEQLVASGLAQLFHDQPVAWRSYLAALLDGYDVSAIQLSIPRDLVDETRKLLAEWNTAVAWKEAPAHSPDALWLDAPQGGRVGTFRTVVARLRQLVQTQTRSEESHDPQSPISDA